MSKRGAVKFCGDDSERSRTIRDLLEIEPVSVGRYPMWVRQAIKGAIARGDLPKSQYPLQSTGAAFEHATKCLGRDWADHCGTIKDEDGRELLVSEPYWERVSEEGYRQLADFAKVVNASFVVSPSSGHFPGRTLRIIVVPRDPA